MPPARPVLRILTPVLGRREQVFEIRSDVVTIGRASDCDLVLLEQSASRVHAQVKRTPDGYLLLDTGSQTGTWVGNQRIDRQQLEDGDRFRIGETELQLVLDPHAQETITKGRVAEPDPDPDPEPEREPEPRRRPTTEIPPAPKPEREPAPAPPPPPPVSPPRVSPPPPQPVAAPPRVSPPPPQPVAAPPRVSPPPPPPVAAPPRVSPPPPTPEAAPPRISPPPGFIADFDGLETAANRAASVYHMGPPPTPRGRAPDWEWGNAAKPRSSAPSFTGSLEAAKTQAAPRGFRLRFWVGLVFFGVGAGLVAASFALGLRPSDLSSWVGG